MIPILCALLAIAIVGFVSLQSPSLMSISAKLCNGFNATQKSDVAGGVKNDNEYTYAPEYAPGEGGGAVKDEDDDSDSDEDDEDSESESDEEDDEDDSSSDEDESDSDEDDVNDEAKGNEDINVKIDLNKVMRHR
eukprot:scaffold3804_cov51-Attheya_sp.AAC.2